MKFEITTNGYKVIHSGVFMLYDSEADATFNVDAENGFKFRVILKFTKNSEDTYTSSSGSRALIYIYLTKEERQSIARIRMSQIKKYISILLLKS